MVVVTRELVMEVTVYGGAVTLLTLGAGSILVTTLSWTCRDVIGTVIMVLLT